MSLMLLKHEYCRFGRWCRCLWFPGDRVGGIMQRLSASDVFVPELLKLDDPITTRNVEGVAANGAYGMLVRMDVGPVGFSQDYDGYDMLLMVGFTERQLLENVLDESGQPILDANGKPRQRLKAFDASDRINGGAGLVAPVLGIGDGLAQLREGGYRTRPEFGGASHSSLAWVTTYMSR